MFATARSAERDVRRAGVVTSGLPDAQPPLFFLPLKPTADDAKAGRLCGTRATAARLGDGIGGVPGIPKKMDVHNYRSTV
jgi:hypothetical protein